MRSDVQNSIKCYNSPDAHHRCIGQSAAAGVSGNTALVCRYNGM